jgi:hypothetical protein
MKLPGPQVISQMREKLKFNSGRHLYGVLGSYAILEHFAQNDLAGASDTTGSKFPSPLNLNRALLDRIDDAELRDLIEREAKRPQQIHQHLNDELNKLLQDKLKENSFLILQHLELLFAYALDFSTLRRHASNQNRILLLLPGQRRGDHIILFHEAEVEFQRNLPTNVIAENHLWELADE